jgi:3-oxo-5alpha-steroid 4-dehydrogenase
VSTNQSKGHLIPLTVGQAGEAVWDYTADVVVVGYGGAGVVAALQAAELGAEVLAIDRFDGGGATAYSGGVIYAAGTRYQRESGYEDTAEEMYKYLEAEGSAAAVGADTLRKYCEGSNADIEWLAAHGIPYGGNAFEEKTAYPPNGYFLYYSGNEKMPAYAAKAKPAPRGHRVAVNGFGGKLHFTKLREAAAAAGVKLLTHAPVTRLVTDFTGAVIGVEVNVLPENVRKQHQDLYKVVHPWRPFNNGRNEKAIAAAQKLEDVHQSKLVRARRGVILSTGGFNHNFEMTKRHRPALAKHYSKLLRLGSIGDDGSGVKLGESVGGATDLMQNISVARTLVPPNIFAHGIVVNEAGKRFVNEAAYAMLVGDAILAQPSGKAWLILEGQDFWTGVWKSFFTGGNFLIWGAPALLNIIGGGTRRASTLEKLAKKIHVDPSGLSASVAEFNDAVRSRKPDEFGKLPTLMHPLSKGPFFAVNMSLDNPFAPAQTITMGGLVLDGDSGAVKRTDGRLVKGLYAAGRVAVGICSNGFVSGVTISDTVFSGRRAARAAVARQAEMAFAPSPRRAESEQTRAAG